MKAVIAMFVLAATLGGASQFWKAGPPQDAAPKEIEPLDPGMGNQEPETGQNGGGGIGVPGFGAAVARNERRHVGSEDRNPDYMLAIQRTAGMANDPEAQNMAQALGLNVLNLTWEDTGRYKNSAVGPNISDMTIQVNQQGRSWCMPVIRFPNYSDKTCDLDPHDFTVLVGNQHGQPLKRVSLYDFLANPTPFMSHRAAWAPRPTSLLAPRDSKVLVSAQACFLPVPKQGKATFNPVIFNYASSAHNPAVLTVLATREGTSLAAVDNAHDNFEENGTWGQRLFHNEAGMRSSLTGVRLADYKQTAEGRHSTGDPSLSMVMLVQIPLLHRENRRYFEESSFGAGGFGGGGGLADAAKAASPAFKASGRASDVEAAVIGHGELEGPFSEMANLPVARDPNLPIRVTVQFYKATSNGVVNEADLNLIKSQIDRVYSQSDSVGSLVVEGETGRPTEYVGCHVQTPYWWQEFWNRYQVDTGETPAEAVRKVRRLLGQDYMARPVCYLYLHNLLRRRSG